MNVPAAAAPGLLRGVGHFKGCAHGLRHPSVALQLELREPWSAAHEEALRQRLGLESLNPLGRLDPARRFAALAVALLQASGWPVTSEHRVSKINAHRSLLLLPSLADQPLVVTRAAAALLDALGSGRAIDTVISALARRAPRGKNSLHLLRAALALDIPVLPLAGTTCQYGWGARGHLMDSTFTSRTPVIGTTLARRKQHGALVMRRMGLPVPEHRLVRNETDALAAAHQLGWPVVTKPNSSDGGRGVTPGITSEAELRQGFAEAREFSPEVLVERHIEGDDYRLTVFGGRVVWVTWRQPGGVTGDGVHDVATLLAQMNADPRRSTSRDAGMKPVAFDAEAEDMLARQGLATTSVPEAGRFVRLRRAANTARGGTPVAANEGVHPDNLALAVQAAAAFDLDVAGIDLLIADIGRSWRSHAPHEVGICEMNAQPQFGNTTQQHLHAQLLSALTRGNGRIPVVLVAGADAAARCAEVMAALGPEAAAGVGLATAAGAWLGGVPQGRCGDLYAACEALLFNRRVQALLVQAEDARLAESGVPMDRIDLLWLSSPLPASSAAARLLRVLARRRRLIVDADDSAAVAEARAADPRAEPTLCRRAEALAEVLRTLNPAAEPPADAAPLPA